MYWLILLISSVLEAVWAIALSESDGFSRPVPTIVFAVAVTLSMIGLGYAMKGIPTSVAYTVWVGVGAVSHSGLYGCQVGLQLGLQGGGVQVVANAHQPGLAGFVGAPGAVKVAVKALAHALHHQPHGRAGQGHEAFDAVNLVALHQRGQGVEQALAVGHVQGD